MSCSDALVSLVSVLIAFCSFMVTAYLAWITKIGPPKFVGSFPYVIIWSFDGGDKNKVGDEFIVPYLWLSNIGARNFLVEEIRLSFYKLNGNKLFDIAPEHSVPMEAIDSPNLFSEFELIRVGQAPFSGFSVPSYEQWKNNYAFIINPEDRAKLAGNIRIDIEVKKLGKNKFKSVLSETINFDINNKKVDWMRWLGEGGPESTYFYKI